MALDARTPLLERVRFLTIYSNNLDEFFMKRVGGIRHAVETGETQPAYEPLTPATLLHSVRQKVHELSRQQSSCWRDMVRPALREAGIRVLSWEELDVNERTQAEAWFRRTVFPILTPLAIDSGHRFPFISNMSVSLGLVLRRPGENEALFARVKVPDVPTRLYELEPGRRYVPVLDIIRHNLDDLFPGMEILRSCRSASRATRNSRPTRPIPRTCCRRSSRSSRSAASPRWSGSRWCRAPVRASCGS
jgi:polyphosphate kinase